MFLIQGKGRTMKNTTQFLTHLLIFLLMVGSLLTACGQVEQSSGGGRDIKTVESYPAPEVQAPAATYTPFPYPEPGSEGAPVVNEKLEASDPSTVMLASGKPQLVEFFAFW